MPGFSSSPEVIIALMGVTGAGKSNFIRLVSGDSRVVVGHTLTSETVDIEHYRFHHKGRNYILVDTPGFDDTTRSNEEIVNQLLSWLASSFREGTRLNGIVYLHRVSDVRMTGTAFENLRMFRKLVGEEALPSVVLVTTFWDTVERELGEQRERELTTKRDFWGKMVERGSPVRRLMDKSNQKDAMEILESIGESKCILRAQEEIVVEGKELGDTAAAKEVAAAHAEMLRRKFEEDQERMRRELQEREEQERQRVESEKRRIALEAELQEQERRRQEEARRREEEARRRREEVLENQRRERERQRQEEERKRIQAELEAQRRAREAELRRVQEELNAERARQESLRQQAEWRRQQENDCVIL